MLNAEEPGPPEGPPTNTLARAFRDLGPAAQATVPGLYAWALTVEPAAYARGAPLASRVAAMCGAGIVLVAPLLETRRPSLARLLSVWGLVATSVFVWVAAPTSFLSPSHPDRVRGLAGVAGWALFAFASCAPALPRRAADAAVPETQPLRRRGDSGRVDSLILLSGIGLAAAVQGVGWQAEGLDRTLLVRVVALAAGILIIGTAASIVGARHSGRRTDSAELRAKRALVPLVLFGLLAVAGAISTLAMRR